MGFKRLLVAALLLTAFLLIPVPADGTTYVIFRYDDLSADKPGERERNALRMRLWEAEKAVDSLFDLYGVPYVIAIVPKTESKYGEDITKSETVCFEEDREKTEFIKGAVQLGKVEVAQHGLSHTNHVWEKNITHRQGEFRERDLQSQLDDIEEGKRILTHSCGFRDVVTFVPPWNGWDLNTARALKKAGFKILSSRRFYWSKEVEGLTIIPSTTSLYELESVVENGNLPESGVIVALYHPPDICEGLTPESSYFGPQRFGELLRKISVLPDVKVVTLKQLAAIKEDLTLDRFRSAVHLQYFRDFWQEVFPKRLLPKHLLPGKKDWTIYLTEAQYQEKVRFWLLVTVTFVAVPIFVGLIIRYVLSRLVSWKWCLIADWFAVVVLFLAIAAEFHLMYKGYHMVASRAIPGLIGLGFLLFRIRYIVKRREHKRRSKVKTSLKTEIETTA
jgi:hypothetical protein